MKKITVSVVFLLFFLLFSACGKKLPSQKLTITRANGTSVTCNAELARTPEERSHGYMGRKHIPSGTGMLFIFEKDQILSFWMKNTPHPLSIAYIDSSGKIKDIFDMKPYSLAEIISTSSVRYALEVPQGWFSEQNIKKGDTISLPSKQ